MNNMQTEYIFITGEVVSGLEKSIKTAFMNPFDLKINPIDD